MIKRIFLVLMGLFLVNVAFAGTSEDIYITPNDYDGSLSVKFVTTIYVEDLGYYYEPFTYQEYFSPYIENLKISDFGDNKLKKTEISNDEDGILYEFRTPEIEYETPYQILYEYKIPYAISKYLGNYDINFFLTNENAEGVTRKVFFCKPKNTKDYIEYDSTPSEYKESSSYDYYQPTSITPISIDPYKYNFDTRLNPYVKEAYPNFCSDGDEERIYSETKYGLDDTIGFYNVQYNTGSGTLETHTEGRFELQIPDSYSYKVSNILKAEKVISNLEDEYKFDMADKIKFKVVDDNDKVFEDYQNEDYVVLCQEGGYCFYKNSGYLGDELEFDLGNTIKALVISASIDTYGELKDNWFTDGYTNKLTLDLMKENNYPTEEIEKAINENYWNETQITSTKILLDIEKTCPEVIKKVNEYIIEKGGVNFADDLAFNNFLLYTFTNVCEGTDIKSIYDKYNLAYDEEVPEIKNSYLELKGKIEPLANELNLKVIEDIKSEFSGIEALFLKGEFTAANYKIEYLNKQYDNSIQPLITTINEYVETKKILEADTSFNLYSGAKDEYLELAMSALNDADSERAIQELEKAKIAHEDAKKNSWITVIVLGLIVLGIGGFVYYNMNKKKKENHKPKKHHHSKKLKEE